MKEYLTKNYPIYVGLLLIALYVAPFYILGENAYIQLFDYLDSEVAHFQSLRNIVSINGRNVVPIMCGIPIEVQHFSPGLYRWIFEILPSYWAIVANITLIRLTAYFGMYFFLTKYMVKEGNTKKLICFMTSLLFAIMPFHEGYGVSSAGVPLLFLAFFNLLKRDNIIPSIIAVIYYAFYSVVYLSGWICGLVIYFMILCRWIENKRFPVIAFVGLCLLGLIYIIRDWNLIHSFINPPYISHRTEFESHYTFKENVKNSIDIILNGQIHSGSFKGIVILAPFCLLFLFLFRSMRMRRMMALLLTVEALIALGVFVGYVPIVKGFDFTRAHFIYPTICFMILAEVLSWFSKSNITRVVAVFMLLVLAFYDTKRDPEAVSNFCRVFGREDKRPSYEQFYSTDLFDEIKTELSYNISTDRVVCLGMYPSVAEYNGIWTLDGLYESYPVEYKHKFYKVIEKELDKSPGDRDRFLHWGCRCFTFINGIGYENAKTSDKVIENPDIHIDALRDLGCTYVLSALPIIGYESLGLSFIKSYTNENSYWNIHVYSL